MSGHVSSGLRYASHGIALPVNAGQCPAWRVCGSLHQNPHFLNFRGDAWLVIASRVSAGRVDAVPCGDLRCDVWLVAARHV